MSTYKDPFLNICIHGVEGVRITAEGRKSPNCPNCFPKGNKC